MRVASKNLFKEIFARLQRVVEEVSLMADDQVQPILNQVRSELKALKGYPINYLDESYIKQVKLVTNELVSAFAGLLHYESSAAEEKSELVMNVKRVVDEFIDLCSEIKTVLQEPCKGKGRMKWFWGSVCAFVLASALALFTQPALDLYGKITSMVLNMSWCGKGVCVCAFIGLLPWLIYLGNKLWKFIVATVALVWGWRWRICVPLSWKCQAYRPKPEDVEDNDMARMLRLYFESSNTDYALMINGAWGVGKTHYVQNLIAGLLRQCHKSPLYVSLNGIKSFDEVAAQIVFSTRWPFMGKIANSVILPFAARWLPEKSISFICTQLKNVSEKKAQSSEFRREFDLAPNEHVIFVDDLERIANKDNTDGVLMDILGRIFDEFISKGYHVIFIGAESEMGAGSRFFKEKEKYIRHTIDFVPNIPAVIDSVIVGYRGLARRHAQLATMFLKRFAVTYHVNNIRTIKRILEGFVLLAAKINDENLLKKNVDRMMEILAPTIVERISGIFCGKSIDSILEQTKANDLSANSEGQGWCKAMADLYTHLYSSDGESQSAHGDADSRKEERIDQHMDNCYKSMPCPCRWDKDSSIVYFAITGLIDDVVLKREINSWTPPVEDQYANALDFVWQFESIEDVDFAVNYPLVVQGLESGQYNAERVNLACALLSHFNEKGWVSIDRAKVIDDATRALKKRWVENPADYINPMLLHNKQEDFLKPIVDAIKEEMRRRDDRSSKNAVEKFFTALSTKNFEMLGPFFAQTHSWIIFDKLVEADKCKEFCDLSNWAFGFILHKLKNGAAFILPSSHDAIERIVRELNDAIVSCDSKKPLRKTRLEELKSKFSEILAAPEFQREIARQSSNESAVGT